jgi:hypothetical protein
MLDKPGVRPEDVRWLARVARARGRAGLADDALLRLVQLHKTSESEEKIVRQMSGAAVAPVLNATPSPAAPPVQGERLVIWRDAANGPLHAALADATGEQADRTRTFAVWQPQWSVLPHPLADQLAVCTLTRIAHLHQVVQVRSVDRWSGPLANAVAHAVGAYAGSPPQSTQETVR